MHIGIAQAKRKQKAGGSQDHCSLKVSALHGFINVNAKISGLLAPNKEQKNVKVNILIKDTSAGAGRAKK